MYCLGKNLLVYVQIYDEEEKKAKTQKCDVSHEIKFNEATCDKSFVHSLLCTFRIKIKNQIIEQ